MTLTGAPEVVQVAEECVEALNASDWERLRATFAADAVWDEVGTQRRVQGVSAVIELSRGWRAAFPDARGTVTNAVAAGDTAVMELAYEGTHDGPMETPQGGIPPSGKKVTVRAVMVAQVRDGRITEVREYFDVLTLLTQIGAAPQG